VFANRVTFDEPGDREQAREVKLQLDVGRGLVVLVLCGVLFILAAIFWFREGHSTAAASFFTLGQTLLVGYLGLAVGERSGAEAVVVPRGGDTRA
jgi:hypothetical protein